MKYIIAIMGPSQSGKTKIIEKIKANACEYFKPKLIAKETTRDYRAEEIQAILDGKEIDVKKVDTFTADLIYQTYGKRTGTKIDDLINIANDGYTPVVIINDIIALKKLKKECEGRDKDICVISIFLFRRIPVKKEFFEESSRRGNVPPEETEQRYDKAKTVYRIFIENIYIFDYILLNAIHYEEKEIQNKDTIIDKQIRAIRDEIIYKNKRPFERINKDKPVLYIISGNAASGKDELIRATIDLGKLYADAVPKYTSRNQGCDDGPEMICRYIVDKNYQCTLEKNVDIRYKELLNSFEEIISLNNRFQMYKNLIEDGLLEKAKDIYSDGVTEYTWWKLYDDLVQMGKIHIDDVFPWAEKNTINPKGYIENEEYLKMVEMRNDNPNRFICYNANGKYEYVIDLDLIRNGLNSGRSQVLVLSDFESIKKLIELFGEQVIVTYCHSQINEEEFRNKNKGVATEAKLEKFQKQLMDFAENYIYYRHVIIYAENEMGHQSDGRQEELIDQLFRLFSAYEEKRI